MKPVMTTVDAGIEMRPHLLGGQLAGADAVRTGVAVPVVGGDDAIGEDVNGGYAARAERRREENAHRLFAGGDDAVGSCAG